MVFKDISKRRTYCRRACRSPTTDEIWLQSQCQQVAEFFKDVNSATPSQECVSLYQYLSAKDDKRTREQVLQAEQRLKSMCTLPAYSRLMHQSGKPLIPHFIPQYFQAYTATAELFQPQLSAVSVACAEWRRGLDQQCIRLVSTA